MPWYIETEGKTQEVRDAAHLETWLQAAEARPIADLFLECVRDRARPGWQKFLHRMLGRALPENESEGSLAVSLAPGHALALFTQSDKHEGEIATVPGAENPKIVPRETAFAALREFYRTGNRPACVTWIKVSGRSR